MRNQTAGPEGQSGEVAYLLVELRQVLLGALLDRHDVGGCGWCCGWETCGAVIVGLVFW